MRKRNFRRHGESLLFFSGSFHLGSGEVPPSLVSSAWWSCSRPSHSHYSLWWKATPAHLDADRDCNYDDGGEAGKAAVESGGEQLVLKHGGGRVDLLPEMLQATSNLSFSLVWKIEPGRTWHIPESSVLSSCSFASAHRKLKGKNQVQGSFILWWMDSGDRLGLDVSDRFYKVEKSIK